MNYIQYEIQPGDTLESIAQKYNLSVDELLDFHNANSGITQQIYTSNLPPFLQMLQIKIQSPEEKVKDDVFESETELKYRCEQVTLTKIDGIIENHATTKTEYFIKKYLKEDNHYVQIRCTDRVLTMQPEYIQQALNLTSEIDVIKTDALLELDNTTGKIRKIINIDEIRQRWAEKKAELYSRFNFVKGAEARKNIDAFIAEVEKYLTEESILAYYRSQPFFELFFDNYLFGNDVEEGSYTEQYRSQLFDLEPVVVKTNTRIVSESPEFTTYVKESNQVDAAYSNIQKMYDERFKPRVGYRFTEYKMAQRTEITINTAEKIIENASVSIDEAVKNNVALVVDYKLKRIQ